MRFRCHSPRQAAALVEFALTASVALGLILTLIVGGMGIFRYQEVAHLAREGARYASTHGGTYISEGRPTQTGVSAISSSSDLSSYLADKTVSMDSTLLQVSVSWTAPSTISPSNSPTYV